MKINSKKVRSIFLSLCMTALLASCFEDNIEGVDPAYFLWESGEYNYVPSNFSERSGIKNINIKVVKANESNWHITETTTMKLGGKWRDIPFKYDLNISNNIVYSTTGKDKSVYFVSPSLTNVPSWEIEGEKIIRERTKSITSNCKVLNVLATEEGQIYQFSTQCEYGGDGFKSLDVKTFKENEGLVGFSDVSVIEGSERREISYILNK